MPAPTNIDDMPEADWADYIHLETFLRGQIEDQLARFVCPAPLVGTHEGSDKSYLLGIGTDYYDNSIELYLSPNDTPAGFRIDQATAEKALSYGFYQGWANYPDGYEQFFHRLRDESKVTLTEARQKRSPEEAVYRLNHDSPRRERILVKPRDP